MILLKLVPFFGRWLSHLILAPLIGLLHHRKFRKFRRMAIYSVSESLQVNLARARRVYQQSVANYAAFQVDYILSCRNGAKGIQPQLDQVEVVGAEKLEPFLTPGKPVLVITMHMGDFQLGFLKLVSSIQCERNLFVFKLSPKDQNEVALFSEFQRRAQNVEVLRATEAGGRKAFLELRKGNVVAMTVDLEINVTSRADVNFFGRMCQMQSGPATIAVLSRAVIIPVINFRDASGRQVVRVEDPLHTDPLSPDEAPKQIIERLTQNIAQVLESWIRANPTQVQIWPGVAETFLRAVPARLPAQ